MTHVGPASTVATAAPARTSYVEWGPVLAGAVLAAALSFVLLTFGTAIGLSATSPWPNTGISTRVLAGLAVLWIMIQQIATFMAGGYVAGRLRTRWQDVPQDEVEFRDGLHGGLVWAVGVVIGAALLMATAGAAARTGIETAGRTLAAADPMEVVMDSMLRPANVAQAGAQTETGQQTSRQSPPATGRANAPAGGEGAAANTRAEMTRLLTSAVTSGSLSNENRTYLVQVVSQRTGLPPQEAEKRVNDAFNAARDAADKARRGAILTGFVTAASLLISFGAAWWAAMRGGHHRDNSVPARLDFNLPRRR